MTNARARFDALACWFETLEPVGLEDIESIYHDTAVFRDPFNAVVGVRAIRAIYQHMFSTLLQPRFIVTGKLVEGRACMMTWQFLFQKGKNAYTIEGCTHFELNAQGLIILHRDYWDAAQELYEKIPLLGTVLRWVRRKLATPLTT